MIDKTTINGVMYLGKGMMTIVPGPHGIFTCYKPDSAIIHCQHCSATLNNIQRPSSAPCSAIHIHLKYKKN